MENSRTGSFQDYESSGWYNRDALKALNRQLEDYPTDYNALKRQAEAEYAPTYALERDALDARLAEQTLAAQNQQAALGRTYERQRQQTNARYDRSAAELNNALTARGLGRSSLAATQGAYLEGQRGMALNDIDRAEADEIAAINSRIALLADETARSRQTMASNYAQQLENRINQLRSGNQTASVSLQLQIAALQQQGYEAYQNWLLMDRAQTLDEDEFRQRYGLNRTASASGSQNAAKPGAKSSDADEQASGSESSKKALSGLIQNAASRLKSTIAALAGRASLKGGSTGGTERVSNVKVKQL
ncbi:MAG: hypothetical protein J5602_06185 [Clostridia bacterium]|nr:hypothetical protein [Clostridia bacterium]MBO4884882.1 hypothetical protein [Clostridia bacterium]